MASRTAGGIHHSVVAGPTRYWTQGDCTRFKKPVRPGLRQSSRTPKLLPSSLHRSAHRACRSILLFLLRCNEVRLLSRRIIIRLHHDVKKKVQKNLPACIARSSSHAQRHEEVADGIAMHRTHACDDMTFAVSHTRRDTPSHTPGTQLLHTRATPITSRATRVAAPPARRGACSLVLRKTAWTKALRAMHRCTRDGWRGARTEACHHARHPALHLVCMAYTVAGARDRRHEAQPRHRCAGSSRDTLRESDARTQRFASKQQRERIRSVAIEQRSHALTTRRRRARSIVATPWRCVAAHHRRHHRHRRIDQLDRFARQTEGCPNRSLFARLRMLMRGGARVPRAAGRAFVHPLRGLLQRLRRGPNCCNTITRKASLQAALRVAARAGADSTAAWPRIAARRPRQ